MVGAALPAIRAVTLGVTGAPSELLGPTVPAGRLSRYPPSPTGTEAAEALPTATVAVSAAAAARVRAARAAAGRRIWRSDFMD